MLNPPVVELCNTRSGIIMQQIREYINMCIKSIQTNRYELT